MSKPKVLYHYTSLENLKAIIATGRITRTCSNLLPPGKTAFEEQVKMNFKPTVWMTNSTVPVGLCVPPSKRRIRFTIPMRHHYAKWDTWATKNNMAPKWRKALTFGMNWQSWYISEYEIPLDDISEIRDTVMDDIIEQDAQGHYLIDNLTYVGNEYAQDLAFVKEIFQPEKRLRKI